MSQQAESGESENSGTEAAGPPTLEVLNRYLAAAAEDREAAEERSAQVIARFTKLTIAMMCVTMVIAGANVAMIISQSGAPQPVVIAPPPPVEMRPVVVQPAQPVLPAPEPAPELEPLESIDPPRPAAKIPLLGSPPAARPRPAPAVTAPRMARTAITPPRPQPLLSVVNTDDDEPGPAVVERW